MIGYALFGVAMIRTETLPRSVRRSSRCLRSGPTAGFGIAQRLDCRLADRDLGQRESWRRPRLVRRSAVAHTGHFGSASVRALDTSMSTGASGSPVANPLRTPDRVRAIIQRLRSSAR
jgi:hypothetical protein